MKFHSPISDSALQTLHQMRRRSGPQETKGLSDSTIAEFVRRDPQLREAISNAAGLQRELSNTTPGILKKDEKTLCQELQADYVNFYPDSSLMPYVPLAGKGPWIVTAHGAVVHDSGGYGMLGMGHAPDSLIESMAQPWVMANVMTPSLSQKRLASRLRREIGHVRGHCPFGRFVCLNSGSECMSLASRFSDINARRQTDSGPHKGKNVMQLTLNGSFHGRTYRPAQMSDCTRSIYDQHLATYRDMENTLRTVEVNDVEALQREFEQADSNNVFFEAFFVEPVMGEGKPGLAMTREYYDLARRLTRERRTLLIVDSIQAALRAHGCLSIVDYPGFEGCAPPDIESYSKALNNGQFPLSVLALSAELAGLYVPGIYGNTMTTNARALEVACWVLDSITVDMRQNIRTRGIQLLEELEEVRSKYPGAIKSTCGTGLMVNAELDPDRYPVVGPDGFEQYLRRHGVSMIHGGENGIRFTPHFGITAEEVDLLIRTVEKGILDLGAPKLWCSQRTAENHDEEKQHGTL